VVAEGSLVVAPGPNSVVIKAGFAVVGLERTVDTNLDIPLFTAYVKPEEFLTTDAS
jgi:hypothetical protein